MEIVTAIVKGRGVFTNCDVIFQGGLNTCDEMWQGWRGGGRFFAQNSVTSFMDGPLKIWEKNCPGSGVTFYFRHSSMSLRGFYTDNF